MVKKEKMQEVDELKMLIENHSVIGVLSMHKLPSKQLQQIRHGIGAKIRMSKRSMILRAIESSDKKEIKKLKEHINGPAALLFTDENPFRLFKILKDSRSPATAKAGDVPAKDIIIQKGSTGLPPGPAISTLQKVGLKSSVQGGKIAVLQDKVVCKAGAAISADLAGVLGLLKIEPLEIGLDMTVVYENGLLYDKSVLDVNVESYIRDLEACATHAVNLSINTNYPTKETIEMMIQKAFVETKSVCVDANILEKDFIDEVLLKSIRQAIAIESRMNANQ